jgi:hypothetical protein
VGVESNAHHHCKHPEKTVEEHGLKLIDLLILWLWEWGVLTAAAFD